VVAWGEIGLDYHYDFSPRAVQRSVFEKQLETAHHLSLPVVVHSREAEADTLEMLRPWVCSRPWGVLHCFSGGRDFAHKGLDLGMYISFSGIITFKKAQDLREIASMVPLDRLLVESDCPYLAPVPHRGKRNEPAWVRETTALLAQLRGICLSDLQERLIENFCRLFDITISAEKRNYGCATK
jgi:TatD DNase family protein